MSRVCKLTVNNLVTENKKQKVIVGGTMVDILACVFVSKRLHSLCVGMSGQMPSFRKGRLET